MSRLTVMITLMVAMAPCLARPNFDDIEQTPMSKDGTKVMSKKGGIPIKGGSQPTPPLGDCDTYPVSNGTSSEARQIKDSLVVAIFPSASFANVEVHMGDIMYMVCVQGSMVNLTKCNSDGAECDVVDVSSAKRLALLTPAQWNYINITVDKSQIDVFINDKNLTAMHMEESVKSVTVWVDGEDAEVPKDYNAIVQYTCEASTPETPVVPVTRSPGDENEQGTPEPQTGTEDSGDEEEEGLNIGIIVGIVAAVIVVAIIAGIIYSKKVRKSADINAQTPLQQQQ